MAKLIFMEIWCCANARSNYSSGTSPPALPSPSPASTNHEPQRSSKPNFPKHPRTGWLIFAKKLTSSNAQQE